MEKLSFAPYEEMEILSVLGEKRPWSIRGKGFFFKLQIFNLKIKNFKRNFQFLIPTFIVQKSFLNYCLDKFHFIHYIFAIL